MAELDASQLRESKLAGRIDQLLGWAKCGQRPSYPAKPDVYILEAEKTDALRNDIIDVIVAELPAFLGAIFPADLREQVQQARNDYYEQALDHGELSGHGEQEARAYGRVEMCDEVLGWLAGSGTEGDTGIRTSVQWAVAYGSPQGDPNESAGILEYDDEADAREHLQWTVDGFLARRTVTSTRWERVEAGTPAPEGEK